MPDAGASPLVELFVERKAYSRPDRTMLLAIAGLSLGGGRGEVVALVGPSGCGKTTALKILAGLDRRYEERLVPDPERLRIGIAFQEPRLLPWRSVEDNVRLCLPARERGRDLGALFEALGLSAWRARYPRELSLGLARRASLARALAGEHQLLILDEPFVSLDAPSAAMLRGVVLDALKRSAASLVLVTHDLREAIAMADRILILAPRPTSVLGEVVPDGARAARADADVEEQRRRLLRQFPALSVEPPSESAR